MKRQEIQEIKMQEKAEIERKELIMRQKELKEKEQYREDVRQKMEVTAKNRQDSIMRKMLEQEERIMHTQTIKNQ